MVLYVVDNEARQVDSAHHNDKAVDIMSQSSKKDGQWYEHNGGSDGTDELQVQHAEAIQHVRIAHAQQDDELIDSREKRNGERYIRLSPNP